MIEDKTGPLMLGLGQQKDLGREQEEDSRGQGGDPAWALERRWGMRGKRTGSTGGI